MQVGKDKVICGVSGGVDSTVTAALINSAIGKNLICVFVDTGLMRENEGKEIKNLFQKNFKIKFLINLNFYINFFALYLFFFLISLAANICSFLLIL